MSLSESLLSKILSPPPMTDPQRPVMDPHGPRMDPHGPRMDPHIPLMDPPRPARVPKMMNPQTLLLDPRRPMPMMDPQSASNSLSLLARLSSSPQQQQPSDSSSKTLLKSKPGPNKPRLKPGPKPGSKRGPKPGSKPPGTPRGPRGPYKSLLKSSAQTAMPDNNKRGPRLPKEVLQLEKALNVDRFVEQFANLSKANNEVITSEEEEVFEMIERESMLCNITKKHSLTFDKMKSSRRQIESLVDTSDDDDGNNESFPKKFTSGLEEEIKEMLKHHIKRKKQRRKMRVAPEKSVSNSADNLEDNSNLGLNDDTTEISKFSAGGSRKKRDYLRTDGKNLTVEQHQIKRKRVWISLAKKEIAKAHKSRNISQKEKMLNCKKAATACMRVVRQKAVQSQKANKETIWRAKRLTREMQAYWRRFDRVEKQQKRQLEKEAEEQQKMDVQLLEAKRQQRKLNFLITQTELFAHFIAKKIGVPKRDDEEKESGKDCDEEEDEGQILNKLAEDKLEGRLAEIDDYDSVAAQTMALNNAAQALEMQQNTTHVYDAPLHVEEKHGQSNEDRLQPALFNGTLKNYQLKGMNWLMNLYDQGINGILADEMGLGKTIQALSMLAFIAEKYNVWGPFLVITPASTLHNWQQEVARFVPAFKVVPYWGSPQERKTLRHFWEQKNLHTRNASFHIVITSYQLVITDFKYFNRIKWQYLVLDEAQAIKSSSSQRWKMLLEFKCRNRLLLSGTPIQNTMAELWSLLHFVMPTIFDSHDEFNDWFSKDIESSAESKSQIDEKQISRLHMILKPFMLRRIKKDVENELTDKVEILLYCPLTIRQKLLYMGLKRKIKVEDLLQGLGSQSQNSAIASSLMNLVMQFRKVCNHPELFERREARSPFAMKPSPYLMPKLICHDNFHFSSFNTRRHLVFNRFCVFNPVNVHRSLSECENKNKEEKSNKFLEVSSDSFSYLRFVDTSPGEQFKMFFSVLQFWARCRLQNARKELLKHNETWSVRRKHKRDLFNIVTPVNMLENDSNFVFTSYTEPFAAHVDVNLTGMPETTQHRLIRTRNSKQVSNNYGDKNDKKKLRAPQVKPQVKEENDSDDDDEDDDDSEDDEEEEEEDEVIRLFKNLVPEIEHVERKPETLECVKHVMPNFLYNLCPRVGTAGRLPYSFDRGLAHKIRDHLECSNEEGKKTVIFGSPELADDFRNRNQTFLPSKVGGLFEVRPFQGFSNIIIPDKQCLVSDCGKLHVLDGLLAKLKVQGHRVLIYSQMTRMIDLLEEFLCHKKHKFIRLDGSSKISERRDMVADFQQRSDIFVFLLSTRAGGLGINLTAADTVIFYDSDWNPTVDQQAMDRAHRLGQTKQVTVYRLICKGTIEERILQRAREKSEIQRMVIQGGSFRGKPGELKTKEVVSLLLDDEEIERKYKQLEMKPEANENGSSNKRGAGQDLDENEAKRIKLESELFNVVDDSNSQMSMDSVMFNNLEMEFSKTGCSEPSSREPTRPPSPLLDFMGEKIGPKRLVNRSSSGGGGKRGRPRGFNKRGSAQQQVVLVPQNGIIPQPETSTTAAGSTGCKKGPGRPRIKPGGAPLHLGTRGPRPRKLKSPSGLPTAASALKSANLKESQSSSE